MKSMVRITMTISQSLSAIFQRKLLLKGKIYYRNPSEIIKSLEGIIFFEGKVSPLLIFSVKGSLFRFVQIITQPLSDTFGSMKN